jgi:hypothetical protein
MTTRKRKTETPAPITGQELLDKVKSEEVSKMTRSDAAIACGYWRFNKDVKGKQYKQARVDRFNKALVSAATGVDFSKPNYAGRGQAKRLKVTSIGAVIVGEAYTRQLNWQIHDECSVTVDKKNNQFIIKKVPKENNEGELE